MIKKTCTKCKMEKPVSEFSKNQRSADGLQYHCKTCRNEYVKTHRVSGRDRNATLLRKYGITVDEYNAMFEKQGGVCALCLNPESQTHSRTKKSLPLSVDHCHESGRVRGLLCADCNKMLGLAKDNVATLAKAIEYLAVAS